MKKTRVLFVCKHNSARSQMAEAIMDTKYDEFFEAESAGLKSKPINPLAIYAMNDYGIDIGDKTTNKVFDYYKEGRLYSYVITVCDLETDRECPVFPGIRSRLNWPFPDPELFEGTKEQKQEQVIALRNEIEKTIDQFVQALED